MSLPAPTITGVTLNVVEPLVSSEGLTSDTELSFSKEGSGIEGQLGWFNPAIAGSYTTIFDTPIGCTGERVIALSRLRNNGELVNNNTVTGGKIEYVIHLANAGAIIGSGDNIISGIMSTEGGDTATVLTYLDSGDDVHLPTDPGHLITLAWTNPFFPGSLRNVRLMVKRDSAPTSYTDPAVFFYATQPGSGLSFDNIPGKTQTTKVFLPDVDHWFFAVVYVDPEGNIVDEIVPNKNLVDTVLT